MYIDFCARWLDGAQRPSPPDNLKLTSPAATAIGPLTVVLGVVMTTNIMHTTNACGSGVVVAMFVGCVSGRQAERKMAEE